MDKDEKIKELEDLLDKMKIGDYLPTRCLEIIKELEDENKGLKIDIEEKDLMISQMQDELNDN